ncbi:MAG: hypothetical protein IKB07_02575 [Lachnospiraceae bacterium]|nr:hypothetical protein [Lachnospiraceae bacterium]
MTKKIVKETERLQEDALDGSNLLNAMNDMPEEWLEHCYETRLASVTEKAGEKSGTDTKSVRFGSFSKTAVKWAVAATVALLLCGGGVAYAAKLGVLQFTKIDDKANSGFSLMTETERISAEELTGEIQEVEGFLRDYMAEEDYSQTYPSWLKQFETVEEARAYIGYAGMKATKVPGTVEEVNVRVIGDTEGNLGEVSLFVRAEEGDIQMNETSAVFTEESPISIQGTGIRHGKDFFEAVDLKPDYRSEEYTTASGKTAVFVNEVYEKGAGGNRWMVGAIVDGALYYEISVLYYPQDYERAKEIVQEWCEQF